MTKTPTRRIAATLCALAVGVLAAGCGGETSSAGTTTVIVTAAGTTATTPATTPTAPATTPTAPATTPTTPTTETTAETAFPDPEEVALLAHIPAETADDCGRTTDTARASAATSSVRCDTETHRVYYEQFGTVAEMRSAYDAYLRLNDVERNEGTTCSEGAPAEGIWDGSENRVACFIDEAGAWVVWNSVDLRLVAVAIDADSNLKRVFRWWGGPASGPIL